MENGKNVIVPNGGQILASADNTDLCNMLRAHILTNNIENFAFDNISNNGVKSVFLMNRFDEDSIPPFKLNTFFTDSKGVAYCATDLRQDCKYSPTKNTIMEMSRNIDFTHFELVKEAITKEYFVNQDVLNPISGLISKAMTSWVLGVLKTGYSLSVVESLTIEAYLSLYFNYRTINLTDVYDDDVALATHKSKQGSLFNTEYIPRVLVENEFPVSLSVMLTGLSNITPKLNGMNTQTMVTLLSRSVYVPNVLFHTMAVLEHPPTMVTILWASLFQKVNKRFSLGRSIENVREIKTIDPFIKSILGNSYIM